MASSREEDPHGARAVVGPCLASVCVCLLLVGVVSRTLPSHLVQVVPLVVALTPFVRRRPWSAAAALPLFAFWLLIMVLIWLWLLGLARIVTGTFSATEVVLTVVIGASSAAGCVASIRARPQARWRQRVVAGVVFAALQVAAMWASFQGWVAGP